MTDYLAMSDGEAYLACGADAMKWAEMFSQVNAGKPLPPADVMVSWFASAMIAMHDHMRPDLAPVIMPDGSAFCVA